MTNPLSLSVDIPNSPVNEISYVNQKEKPRLNYPESKFVSYHERIIQAAYQVLNDRGNLWNQICREYLNNHRFLNFSPEERLTIALDALKAFTEQIDILGEEQEANLISANQETLLALINFIDINYLNRSQLIAYTSIYHNLGIHNPFFLQNVFFKIMSMPNLFSKEDIFNLIWIYTNYSQELPHVLGELCNIIVVNFNAFQGQEIAIILEKLTSNNFFPVVLFNVTMSKFLENPDFFSADEISIILTCLHQYSHWDMSILKDESKNFIKTIAQEISKKISSLSIDKLYNVMFSLECLQILKEEPQLVDILFKRFQLDGEKINSKIFMKSLLIFFQYHRNNLEFLQSLAQMARPKISFFDAHEIIEFLSLFANFFKAYPQAFHSFNIQIFEEYSKEFVRVLDKFNYQQIATLHWACKILKVYNPEFYSIVNKVQDITAKSLFGNVKNQL